MKTTYKYFFVCCIVLLLAAFIGCKPLTDSSSAERVFTINGDIMTDGTVTYQRLYSEDIGWDYRGFFPYTIGTVKDGNALLASDETGIVVKEQKNPSQDMDFRPWIRSDVMPSDLSGDDCLAKIVISDETFLSLSDEAKAEVLACRNTYLTSSETHENLTDEPFGWLYFESKSIPGFVCDSFYFLTESTDHICIVDDKTVIGSFGPDTALYQEINANR